MAAWCSGPVLGTWTRRPTCSPSRDPRRPARRPTLSRDPAVGEVYAADELVWHGPFKRTTLEALDAGLRTINAARSSATLPTLWVHGAEDQLVPLAETRAGIETLGLTALEESLYDGARHEVFNETNKDEVLGQVADFVDRVTA